MPHPNPSTLNPNPSLAALPHNSDLSIWLSVDPLSDKYPNLSPYVYCADNPVRLVDVDGREVWILGEELERKMIFSQLQAATTLPLKLNKDGRVTIAGTVAQESLSETDYRLHEAFTRSDVTVNITAISYSGSYDYDVPGGSHLGTEYKPESNTAVADQRVNPYLLSALDILSNAKNGSAMLHETLEGYYCCLESIQNKKSIEKAIPDNPTYDLFWEAHCTAPAQPVLPQIDKANYAWYGLANGLYCHYQMLYKHKTHGEILLGINHIEMPPCLK